jgi:hypothetical protein
MKPLEAAAKGAPKAASKAAPPHKPSMDDQLSALASKFKVR